MRYLALVVAFAAAPILAQAQDTTHRDTTRHDSSAVERKTNNTVDNAGEGVKQANDQVDNAAYKVGTDIKHIFKPKKKKPAKPDSTAARDSTRDSTPH
jgi:Ni/Co efflux regulator RcnB